MGYSAFVDYPPGAFFFRVTIDGAVGHFQEVSGLEHEIEIEEIADGGNNGYKIKAPTRIKYNNLVFKRGLVHSGNESWAKFQQLFPIATGPNQPITHVKVEVELLDEKQTTIAKWTAPKAFPVKWNIGGLNAMESKLAIESVEFAHHGLDISSL